MALPITVPLPYGGEALSSFNPSDSSVVDSAGVFNGTYSTQCIAINPGSTASTPAWNVANPFWMHWVAGMGLPYNAVGDSIVAQFYQGSVEVARVTCNDLGNYTVGTFKLWTLQGASLVAIGATANAPLNLPLVLNTFDVGLTAGSSGVATFCIGGTVQFQATGLNHASWSGVTNVVLCGGMGATFNPGVSWSQVIFNNTPTVGYFLYHKRLNTNSAVNTGWTGSVTNINEIPTSDASPLIAATPGLVSTFSQNGLSLTGNITALLVCARFRVQGAGPPNNRLTTRVAGANYPGPPLTANVGFLGSGNSWTTNPATGLPWTAVAISGTEDGTTSST